MGVRMQAMQLSKWMSSIWSRVSWMMPNVAGKM
jgi:hypothetical protein